MDAMGQQSRNLLLYLNKSQKQEIYDYLVKKLQDFAKAYKTEYVRQHKKQISAGQTPQHQPGSKNLPSLFQ